MSPLLLKGLAGVGTVGIVGTSSWGILKLLEPKTIGEKLISEGHSFPDLVGDSDLAKWKEFAKKHKDNSINSDLKFTGLTVLGTEATDEEARKLRDECKKTPWPGGLDQSNHEKDVKKLKQWCVVNNADASSIT